MDEATHNRCGNHVATAVWHWLEKRKRISYVPWVFDADGSQFDPVKAAEQRGAEDVLAELEQVIAKASEDAKQSARSGAG